MNLSVMRLEGAGTYKYDIQDPSEVIPSKFTATYHIPQTNSNCVPNVFLLDS